MSYDFPWWVHVSVDVPLTGIDFLLYAISVFVGSLSGGGLTIYIDVLGITLTCAPVSSFTQMSRSLYLFL